MNIKQKMINGYGNEYPSDFFFLAINKRSP